VSTPAEHTQWADALRSKSAEQRRAALSSIYAAYGPGLLSLCLRITCHRVDAEDALQETFVQVLRYGGDFRGEALLRTWIARIAIRTSLAMRARRTQRATVVFEDTPGPESEGPAERAADQEAAARLLGAIDRLPAEQRVVLALAAFEGVPGAEIAQILGIPEGTVHSRMHAARERLRSLLRAAPRAGTS